jgi:hypothetical protein
MIDGRKGGGTAPEGVKRAPLYLPRRPEHACQVSACKKKNWRQKGRQHPDFPGGHPPEYYPSLRLLNFTERTGYGVLSLRWPSTPGHVAHPYLCPPLPPYITISLDTSTWTHVDIGLGDSCKSDTKLGKFVRMYGKLERNSLGG